MIERKNVSEDKKVFAFLYKTSKELSEKELYDKVILFLKEDNLNEYSYLKIPDSDYILILKKKNIEKELYKPIIKKFIVSLAKALKTLKEENKKGGVFIFYNNNKLFAFSLYENIISFILEDIEIDIKVFVSLINSYKEKGVVFFYEDYHVLEQNIKLAINIITNVNSDNFIKINVNDRTVEEIKPLPFNKNLKSSFFQSFLNKGKKEEVKKTKKEKKKLDLLTEFILKNKTIFIKRSLPIVVMLFLGGAFIYYFFFYDNLNSIEQEEEIIPPVSNSYVQEVSHKQIDIVFKEKRNIAENLFYFNKIIKPVLELDNKIIDLKSMSFLTEKRSIILFVDFLIEKNKINKLYSNNFNIGLKLSDFVLNKVPVNNFWFVNLQTQIKINKKNVSDYKENIDIDSLYEKAITLEDFINKRADLDIKNISKNVYIITLNFNKISEVENFLKEISLIKNTGYEFYLQKNNKNSYFVIIKIIKKRV